MNETHRPDGRRRPSPQVRGTGYAPDPDPAPGAAHLPGVDHAPRPARGPASDLAAAA